MTDALLDDLDADQRAAVTSSTVPLAIIAPAGSGKTRVLTRRIAFRLRENDAVARHVLAVTFTRRAAGELVHRIGRLGVDGPVTAGTFHAIALGQLRGRAAERNQEPPGVLESKTRLVATLVDSGPGVVADLVTEIEWAKARMVTPERYALAVRAAQRRVAQPVERVTDVYTRYEKAKRKKHVVDFDDVLMSCISTIETDEEFAAQQRWRYRHLFVDEFQDATPLQLRLLGAWLGTNIDLTVVGDPAQAIYAFSGADASALLQFDQAYTGGSTIALTRNYRSTPSIVRVAEAALATTDTGPRHDPQAVRSERAAPTVTAYDDDAAEAAAVAAACKQAHAGGMPWRNMAVLFRTNAQSAIFATALEARRVPCRTRDESRAPMSRAMRAALARLYEFERKTPGRPIAEYFSELASDHGSFPTSELRAGRDTVIARGRDYVALDGHRGGVRAFSSWFEAAAPVREGESGVQLVTFHRAKGLEWSIVFVTGLERGLVPISWADSPDALSEERRLLHVALSRAEDELHCSWAHKRTLKSRTVAREPSPWIAEIEREAHADTPPPRAPRDHLLDLRESLAHATPPAPPESRANRSQR